MERKFRPLVPIIATALLAALAAVLYALGIPLFPPPAAHLRLDFSDVPALLAGIAFGPIYGVAVNLIQNIIGLIAGSFAAHAGLGNLMNFIVGTAFVVPYAVIIRRARRDHGRVNRKDIVLASAAGIASIIVIGLAANIVVTPLFFRLFTPFSISLQDPETWIVFGFATILNTIKGVVLTTAGAIFIYLPLRGAVDKYLQGRQ